ncbi:MAG: hypothetical protein ACRBFS_11840 [Aureispira sp.]
MRQLICIAWMILVGLQTGYQGMVYAYYTLQKEQITKDFCENKDRPALRCDGKCHLKTMLAASEDPETSANESSTPPKEIHLQPLVGLLQPLTTFSSILPPSISLWEAPNNGYYVCHYDHLAAFELLDPPKQAAISILG